MEYHSKYTGAEVDALLGKVESGDVGGKVTVDSALSTESENPVMNKVITEELNKKAPIEALTTLGESVANSITSLEEKKANKTDVAQSDWNASKQEKGHILNRTHYVDLTYFEHLTINKNDFDLSFDGSYWIAEYNTLLNEEQLFVYCSAEGKEFYSPIGDSEIKLPNSIYVKTIDVYSDDGDFVGIKLVVRNGCIDEEFRGESFYFADIWSYPHIKELPSIYIPDTIAREESVEELRDETTALWENLDHGVFPDLVAGDLAGRGESVPASFGFRASGGKSIKDGRAYIKRIKGNSVVWNQLLPDSTITVTSNTTRALNEGTRIVVGHKYLLLADFGGGNSYAGVSLFARVSGESKRIVGLANNENKTYKFFTAEMGGVSNGTGSAEEGNIWQYFYFESTTESITNTRLIDLTKAFPNDWQNINTIEEFNARVATLGVDLNAYNEGQVIHCNTESIKSVGDNAWDEQWESGRYAPSTGLPNTDEGIRSKNSIKVLPNENYWCSAQNDIFAHFYDAEGNLITNVYSGQYNYLPIKNKQFTTPANAATMTFYVVGTTTYNHDILISLYHSGWKAQKDDQYQPYWQDILPLPIIRKYFPDGMKSAGSAHDEIRYNKASGKWEKVVRIGEVDMGALSWVYDTNNLFFRVEVPKSFTRLPFYSNNPLCVKYFVNETSKNPSAWLDKEMALYNGAAYPLLGIKDSAYTDAASFKTAMAGVILYYELANPIVTELDAEDQNFRDYYNVADFGTEQSQSSVPSAAFSADIIYQFNAVDMIREHEIEITELQKVIATMQAQLTSLINNNA